MHCDFKTVKNDIFINIVVDLFLFLLKILIVRGSINNFVN